MNALTKANPATVPLSEERERELLKDAQSYIYQSEDGFELVAHCFFPENNDTSELKPAIVFFHGGLWDVSMSTQFAPHCMHFASRGMVAVAVEYRVSAKHQSSPEDAVEDAQMAMLWLKHNHAALGVDPNRIIAAGAASGAHMALSLAMLPDVIEIDGYSPRPLGVIALSAIVDTTKKSKEFERFRDAKLAVKHSPSKLARRGLCPMLLVHGKSDTIVPYEPAARFAKLMKRKKNKCEFIDFEAANHSFFNFNVSARHFEITLNSMDAFLAGLDCIEPMEYY
ncbi:MAG: alpha/beta hydrolase fold domain-containing protein [Verrucomicrobiae bacterium]|nr:alpha/beta hydrolase fold domain-containing protein [Verrucomicrobiae bacterium]NNJ86182.1 alpha/beta hydrolase fold domain-containing protein [Akkermansiaceae bacterium]